ncbi:hypothetical protein [Lignipirellula cremea]|uniref:Arrestin-like N-terminal domain-containing protein n=1 Tax=Lignipirellula cremea TaxID=2528010 RepID=A0A518DVP5_9BACT|nr:hypothetical protein [Lignipirellula cremea]QDU95904.1 hypothetical protein Pla8534_37230 [Lignipirellula cremea]
MMEPLISLTIRDPHHVFRPGEILECEHQIDAVGPGEVKAIESSVLWWTEGKGDEDFGVHYFERRTAGDADEGDLRTLHRFQTALPNSPLTYEGRIVKIHWCVRVRVFLRQGKEAFFEYPFRLGDHTGITPAAQPTESESTDDE